MAGYTLNYFDSVRGLGEPIRLIFTYSGVDFKDNRISHADWPTLKSKAPTSKLPYLEFDGHVLPESGAILRFLGRKFKLNGQDEFEAAKVDSIFETFRDMTTSARPWFGALRNNQPDAEQLFKDAYVPARDSGFNYLLSFINKSKSGFLVDSGVSWADFFIAEVVVTLINVDKNFETAFPEIVAYQKKVHALPQIKDYVSKRPFAQF